MLGVRRQLYRLLEKRKGWGLVVNLFLALLVVTSVVSMIVSSDQTLYLQAPTVFFVIEAVCVSFFMLEYLLRLWCCIEKQKMQALGPLLGRLRWMVKITSIIDFVTTIPFFILLALDIGIDGVDFHRFSFLSVLRILRIFRLLKMERFMFAMLVLQRIFTKNSSLLLSLLFFELVMYLCCCSLLFLLENDLYPSIPSAMYMGVLILIGAGTPDTELSPAGKAMVGVYIFLSVVIFALPAGILAGSTGIESVAEELQKKRRQRKRQKSRELRQSQLRASALNQDDDDDMQTLLENDDWDNQEEVITCPHCHKQFSQD